MANIMDYFYLQISPNHPYIPNKIIKWNTTYYLQNHMLLYIKKTEKLVIYLQK